MIGSWAPWSLWVLPAQGIPWFYGLWLPRPISSGQVRWGGSWEGWEGREMSWWPHSHKLCSGSAGADPLCPIPLHIPEFLAWRDGQSCPAWRNPPAETQQPKKHHHHSSRGAQELQSGHQSSAHQVPSGVWGCIFGSGVTQPFPELQENGIKVSGCLFLPFFGPLQAAAPCH